MDGMALRHATVSMSKQSGEMLQNVLPVALNVGLSVQEDRPQIQLKHLSMFTTKVLWVEG